MSTAKPDLTRVWASEAPGGNVVDPDVTTPGKFAAGWLAEVPPFENFNYLQKQSTQGLAHINEQGICQWDANTLYPVNALVKGSDGLVYIAISEQSNHNPVGGGGVYWEPAWSKAILNFTTVASAKASTKLIPGIHCILIKERADSIWDVISGTGTANDMDVLEHDTLDLSFSIRIQDIVNVVALGAVAGASDSLGAIQRAIDIVEAEGGGIVYCPGAFSVSGQLTISSNNTKLKGRGDGDQIKYTGSSQIDYLVYVESTATEGWSIEDLRLVGGDYQEGKVKWVLYAEEFHRECLLRNVVIREGLGLLNIQAAYYGKIENVQCVQTVPDPQNQGWSLADWQEVYGAGTAPIYLGGNGGATQIDRFTMSKVGSETHTGNTGVNIVLFDRASCQVGTMSYEACGVDYDTFSPRTINGIQAYFAWVTCNTFYSENTGAETRGYYAVGRGQLVFNTAFIYQFNGGAGSRLFDNDSTHELVVRDGEIYRISADVFARGSSSSSGGGSRYDFGNCVTATGERYTDATVNAYQENCYDTRGSLNPLGLPDVDVLPTNPRDSVFPAKNIGLVVTSGSDANGSFVQVTGGSLMNDRTRLVNNRIPTSTNAGTMVVYKLRPQTVSYYYRVYVGIAGNLWLEESASAFTDDRGNWLAGFQTDGAGAVTSLADNPRLSIRGTYLNGKATMSLTANPSSGNFAVGDRWITSTPSVGATKGGWCTVAGAPGTWVSDGNL